MLNWTEDQWNALMDTADETIQKLISEFPQPLQDNANSIICYLSKYANIPEGDHVLGVACRLEKVIVIYLGDIYEMCNHNIEHAMQSVRQVYLHELGHHFDLGEYDLQQRGL